MLGRQGGEAHYQINGTGKEGGPRNSYREDPEAGF